MTTGRPTLYRPEYCEAAIEFMAQGYSITAFAGHMNVSRQTVYQWAQDYPAFSDALNTARAKSAEWWETRARITAETGAGNATVVVCGLKNRVADEWRDVSRQEHVSPDGSMTPRPAVAMTMTPEQAAQAYAAMIGPDET